MRRASFAAFARNLLIGRAPRLFLRLATPDDEELGRLGEELAARALAARGWRLAGRRTRTPWAEVDVVAWDGEELVCLEVKAGRLRGEGLRYRPGLRVDRARLERLAGAGRWLARRWGSTGAGGRVDLAEVLLRGAPPRIELRFHRDLRAPLPGTTPGPAPIAARLRARPSVQGKTRSPGPADSRS